MSTDYDLVCRPCRKTIHLGQWGGGGWSLGYGSNDEQGRKNIGNFIMEHVGHADLIVINSDALDDDEELRPKQPLMTKFVIGQRVCKGGEYNFDGVVVSVFSKTATGAVRYVVENKDGILHIFNEQQLYADQRISPCRVCGAPKDQHKYAGGASRCDPVSGGMQEIWQCPGQLSYATHQCFEKAPTAEHDGKVAIMYHGGPFAGSRRVYEAHSFGDVLEYPCANGDKVIYRRDESEMAKQHLEETGEVVFECIYNGAAKPIGEAK